MPCLLGVISVVYAEAMELLALVAMDNHLDLPMTNVVFAVEMVPPALTNAMLDVMDASNLNYANGVLLRKLA